MPLKGQPQTWELSYHPGRSSLEIWHAHFSAYSKRHARKQVNKFKRDAEVDVKEISLELAKNQAAWVPPSRRGGS